MDAFVKNPGTPLLNYYLHSYNTRQATFHNRAVLNVINRTSATWTRGKDFSLITMTVTIPAIWTFLTQGKEYIKTLQRTEMSRNRLQAEGSRF